MSNTSHITLNGLKMRASEATLTTENRAFRYGDALFETIRCVQQVPLFFEQHYARLVNGMALLQMQALSLPPMDVLKEHIVSLITKNKIFGDARIRLTVFRQDGGLYTPTNMRANWLIEAGEANGNGYELNTKGLLVDIYEEDFKYANRLAQFKSANALFFVLAGIYKKSKQLDDVLIMNDKHLIIEGLASNLFWFKNKVLYTPGRTSGCVDGIMRRQVLKIATENGVKVQEVSGTGPEELLQADEVFLTNAIQGIQWVVGIANKRFFCNDVKQLHKWLQQSALNYLTDSQEN